MKLRTLTYGIPANHESLTVLPDLSDPVSLSDFDALVLDPNHLAGRQIAGVTFERRQIELQELTFQKGGIVIFVLQPRQALNVTGPGNFDSYSLLHPAAPNVQQLISATVRPGQGTRMTRVEAAGGPSYGYFEVLKGRLGFSCHLDTSAHEIEQRTGKISAIDSIGRPVGADFKFHSATVCFVPVWKEATGEQLGAALARMVKIHYESSASLEVPPWANTIIVPGTEEYSTRIESLVTQKDQLAKEISLLDEKRAELQKFSALFYGTGKSVLEPTVRSALRLIGFTVPEPEEYAGEWDVEIKSPEGMTAIAEVEGSEGPIDVRKFRQLLNYVQDEALEGRDHKGVLIGNGFRLTPPESPERQQQFSEHAQRGATKNDYCLLPTTELFNAVCAVLESPKNEGLLLKIRESIFSTVGGWSFSPR